MEKSGLTKRIILNKKEAFYPLFTIIFTFLIYWITSLFIDFADSHTIFPFLFFTLDIFIIKYTMDFYRELKNKNLNKTSILALFLSSIFLLSLFTILGLILLLLSDIFYLIPISIHLISIFIIYYFLRREMVKYYEKKTGYSNKLAN